MDWMTGMSAEPGQSGGSPQAIADAILAGIDGSARVGLVSGSDTQALEDVRQRVQFDLLAQGREAVRISGRNLTDLNAVAARLDVAGRKDAGEALRVYARAGLDVALLIDGAEDLSGAVVPPLNALLKSPDIGPRLLVLLFGSDAAGPIASLLADGLGQGAVIRTTMSPPQPIVAPPAQAPGVAPDGGADIAAGAEFTEELIEAAHDAGPDVPAPAQVPEDNEPPVSEAAHPAPDTATAQPEPEVAPHAAAVPAAGAAEPPVHAEDEEPGRPVVWQPEGPAANVNVPLTPEPVAAYPVPPGEHEEPLELAHHAVSAAVVGGAIATAPQVVPSGRWAEIGSAPATVAPRRRRGRRGRVLVPFLVIVAIAAGGAWAVVHYRAELPPAVRERVERAIAAIRPLLPARLIQGVATQTGTGQTGPAQTAAPEAAAPSEAAPQAAMSQPATPPATAPEPAAAGAAAQPAGSPPPSPPQPTASAPPQAGSAPASAAPAAAEAPAASAPPAAASAPATTERDAAGAPVRLRPGFTTNPSEQTPATERVAPGAVAPAPPAPPPVSSHESAASVPSAPTPAAPAAGSPGTPAPVSGPGSRSDAVPTQPEQQQAAAAPVVEEPKPGAAETPEAAASMPAGAGTGPGLLVIARSDDTLRSLYDRVYRGQEAPPFDTVAAMNPRDLHTGDVVVFPAPRSGWRRQPVRPAD